MKYADFIKDKFVAKNGIRISIYICLLLAFISSFIVLHSYQQQRLRVSQPLCKDCNVLLISLDTCGAKHMSMYGYERDTTPNLAALAKEGIFFEHAYANATWTLPSHISIFTGLFPFVHQVTREKDDLSSTTPFLPQLLQEHGYQTIFYLPNLYWFSRNGTSYRGISSLVSDGYDTPGYFDRALDTLNENSLSNKKSFIFFHTYMCHAPYVTGDEPLIYTTDSMPSIPVTKEAIYTPTFTEEYLTYLLYRLPLGFAKGEFLTAPDKIQLLLEKLQKAPDFMTAKAIYADAVAHEWWGEEEMTEYQQLFYYWNKIDVEDERQIRYLKAIYDQRVHSADKDIIGVLRNRIQEGNIPKNTLIIITADHGEEFMEHRNISHTTLYDYNTQVPLIFLIPGKKAMSIQEPVQSVDIVPSVLDLVGIKTTDIFNGQSLLPLFNNGTLKKRLIIANGDSKWQSKLTSIRENDWKVYVQDNEDGTVTPYELYNTKIDPNEQSSVFVQNMKKADDIVKRYKILKNNLYPRLK